MTMIGFFLTAGGLQAEDGGTADTKTELQSIRLKERNLELKEPAVQDWKEIDKLYGQFIKKHPRNSEGHSAYGEFLLAHPGLGNAEPELKEAERLDPKNASVLTQLGEHHLSTGNTQLAFHYFARASELEPGNADYHFNVANVAFMFRHDLGRTETAAFDLALTHFAEASRLAPANSDYLRAYAETYYILPNPDWQKALSLWDKYFQIAPSKEFALLNMARVHMKLRQRDEALSCLNRIQNHDFDRLKLRLAERIEAEIAPAAPNLLGAPNSSKPAIDVPPPAP